MAIEHPQKTCVLLDVEYLQAGLERRVEYLQGGLIVSREGTRNRDRSAYRMQIIVQS